MVCELDGDADSQLRQCCLCRPIFRGIAPSVAELTPYLRERIEHHAELYRSTIRPILVEGKVCRHTPFLPLHGAAPRSVLQRETLGGSSAVVGLLETPKVGPEACELVPRGLDAAADFDLTLDNSERTFRMPGSELAHRGLEVRLERTMSSELVIHRRAGS